MLDTPVMPAGQQEEETSHDHIFREFMAGYPLYRVPLFSDPLLLPCRKFCPGVQFAPRLMIFLCDRRVARFEELVDGGRRFLTRFRQELGYI
jgi:hypothetical protein